MLNLAIAATLLLACCIAIRRIADQNEQIRKLTRRLEQIVATHAPVELERERNNRLLQKSERDFRYLAENAPDNIVRYGSDLRIQYINPLLEKTLGVQAAQLIGLRTDEIYPDNPAMLEYQALLEQVVESGQPAEYLMVNGPDGFGRTLYDNIRIAPEFAADGTVAGVIAIGRDITERKRMEEALRHNISDLEKTKQDLNESHIQLRALAARLESVREEESKHLAREIHDELGQLLTTIQINVYVLRMQCGTDNPQLSAHIETTMSNVEKTIQVVRDVTAKLRPVVLDMGVAPALEWLVNGFTGRTGVTCELHIDDEKNIALNKAWETAIFRIVQESLTNITRHAEASQVKVSLKVGENNYLLKISDNGKGFDPDKRKKKSFGLLGISERVLMCGGELDMVSAPDQGTVIQVRIPLFQKQMDAAS